MPKALRSYILKEALYRQLGNSYEEALANLPRVHREIEQIFQGERLRHPGERAAGLIRTNLGDIWLSAAKAGALAPPNQTIANRQSNLCFDSSACIWLFFLTLLSSAPPSPKK